MPAVSTDESEFDLFSDRLHYCYFDVNDYGVFPLVDMVIGLTQNQSGVSLLRLLTGAVAAVGINKLMTSTCVSFWKNR